MTDVTVKTHTHPTLGADGARACACGRHGAPRPLGMSEEVHDALFGFLDEVDALAGRLLDHGIGGVRALGEVIIAKHILLDAMERAADLSQTAVDAYYDRRADAEARRTDTDSPTAAPDWCDQPADLHGSV